MMGEFVCKSGESLGNEWAYKFIDNKGLMGNRIKVNSWRKKL